MNVSVIGAAAIIDYIYQVEELPQRGEIKLIAPADQQNELFYCGGGAPNIACVLAKLGLQTHLIYPVGDDFSNSECAQSWQDLGVDLSGLHIVSGERSGFAYLFFEDSGDSMCFAYPGVANTMSAPSMTTLNQTVVIGPVYNAFTKRLLKRAIVQDCNIILTGISAPQISEYFAYIDTMIVNKTEAGLLCAALGHEHPQHIVPHLRGQKLFITYGASGSVVYSDDLLIQLSATQPKRFLDPTGAGDAYSAGVVFGMQHGFPLDVCGLIGSAVASFVVEKFGSQTNLPTWEDIKQRLHKQVSEKQRLPF